MARSVGSRSTAASRNHPLDAASPLLHQAEFVEHPTDDAVAQLRDAEGEVSDGQTKR